MSEQSGAPQETSDELIEAEQARVDEEKAEKPELPGVGGVAGDRLKSYIERVERLEEEKKAIAEDIKDIYTEAKAAGFEVKIVRKVVSLRKMELEKRREESELLELYMAAIGMAE